MVIIETERLLLRQWREQDNPEFARLNADSTVMEYFPNTLSPKQSDAAAARYSAHIKKNRWGFWATDRKDTNEFIGFIGLNYNADGLPFAPCVDIGWRLAAQHWGQGFATEGAHASMRYAFTTAGINEVVSMTPVLNKASEKIMLKLGMRKAESTFAHPKVPERHVLNEHLLYTLTAEQWRALGAIDKAEKTER